MTKHLPEVSLNKVSETSYEYHFVLEPDLKWFEGHFPHRKLFPGVAQLYTVDELSKGLLKEHFPHNTIVLSGLSQFKFICPMVPNDKVILNIDLDLDKKRLRFKFQKLSQKGYIPSAEGIFEITLKD